MTLLTQRNATIVFGLAAAWATVHAAFPNLLPPQIEEYVAAVSMGLGTFLVFVGFSRTPSGNTLPPEVVTQIDRQATLAKAGDAVVDAVASKVTDEAKSLKDDTPK